MKKRLKRYTLGRANQQDYPAAPATEHEDAMRLIHEMVMPAAEVMEQILEDPKTPDRAQMLLADIILNRTYGSPRRTIQVESEEESMERSIQEAEAFLQPIIEKIQREMQEEEERRNQNTE